MTTQNYLVVENNVVINNIVWNGDVNTWQPPLGATMLIQETTPAMVWDILMSGGEPYLAEVIGGGQIGFIWDGTVLMTNQPKP
jgi:hypothetical protein